MKMVLVIITCFVVTLLPMLVEKLLYSVGVIGITPKFHMFAVTLYISNSALNPIIYASRYNRHFRHYYFRDRLQNNANLRRLLKNA